MRTVAIVNPASAGGQTGRRWPELRAELEARVGPFETLVTTARGWATDVARRALEGGADCIVAVGGDGTLNEVVNGFFDSALRPINADAVLVPLTSGSGGDFARSFDFAAIGSGRRRRIDLGRLDFLDHDGRPATRLFDNIASFGLTGYVLRDMLPRFQRSWLSPARQYFLAGLCGGLTYSPRAIRLLADDALHELRVNFVAVANGKYFGSGMMVAPQADPADGLFDVVAMPPTDLRQLKDWRAIYQGRHIGQPDVVTFRTAELVAESLNPERTVLIDCDGETPGRLPARFTIMPSALTLGA